MSTIDPIQARKFACDVVGRLHSAGFQALWAGGCVRDELRGVVPKDYDVATDATPDQIRDVFGRRRTLAVGAAFGVITVLGSPRTGQIEVATFRQDASYSDGRHPDSVEFSSPEEDAKRRDFTINGLFYDPQTDEVIDYVGGQEDLRRGIVRAIGNPSERIAEDKLRMLRAVRFTAALGFSLDPNTQSAILQDAAELAVVSAERIAMEMRRMLTDENRDQAMILLRSCGLLNVVMPEADVLTNCDDHEADPDSNWLRMLTVLKSLAGPDFPDVLAAALYAMGGFSEQVSVNSNVVCRRWKLSNDETKQIAWLLANVAVIRRAIEIPWPKLQRVLISPLIKNLLVLCEALAATQEGLTAQTAFCRQKLELPDEQLNPAPLVTGDDLIAHGIRPGRHFKLILDAVRDAQLDGDVTDSSQALKLADQVWHKWEDK